VQKKNSTYKFIPPFQNILPQDAVLSTSVNMTQQQRAEQNLQEMTTKFVEKIRPMLFAPVSMQQFVTAKDSQAKGPLWVSRTQFKKAEDGDNLQQVVKEALDHLAPGKGRDSDFTVDDVDAQWTSFNPSGGERDPEPSISEREKYDSMMKDITTDIVVLYVHGGFY
jgi:hypothetical protein